LPAEPAAVLYDEGCGFCRWTLGLLLAWDWDRALEPVPIQSRRGAELLADLTAERRLDSWHLVIAGELRSAGAALAPLAGLLPGGGAAAALFEMAPVLTERCYRWIAAHRNQIGRLVPSAARRSADRRIERRRGMASRTGPGA
jgi:predicted DCC family thiol-disulfide oxidoreductase YuxK